MDFYSNVAEKLYFSLGFKHIMRGSVLPIILLYFFFLYTDFTILVFLDYSSHYCENISHTVRIVNCVLIVYSRWYTFGVREQWNSTALYYIVNPLHRPWFSRRCSQNIFVMEGGYLWWQRVARLDLKILWPNEEKLMVKALLGTEVSKSDSMLVKSENGKQ